MTKYYCMDCGKEVSGKRSARCQSCAQLKVWDKKGRKCPNFCIDCGTNIGKTSTRCMQCFHKHRSSSGKLDIDIRAKISATLSGSSFEEAKIHLLERDKYSVATTREEHLERIQITKRKNGQTLPIGSTHIDKSGYIWQKIGYRMGRQGWVLQHRLIMGKHIGRKLDPSEIVHHIDNNPSNNTLSNLAVITKRQHGIINKIVRFIDNPIGGSEFAEIILKTIRVRFPDTFQGHDTTSISGLSSST